MKIKKIAVALAALLCASTFVACTDDDKKITLLEYWKVNENVPETIDETLTYTVKFEKSAGWDSLGYELVYNDGTYTTKLKTSGENYTYTSTLEISGSYTYEGESKAFSDSVVSSVTFQRKSPLTPVRSTKTVKSHTPANGKADELKDCYALYDYTIETNYASDGKATSILKYNETESMGADEISSDFSYTKGDYNYLDNEQLLLGLRAVQPTTTSGKFRVYNPAIEGMQRVKFAFQEEETTDFNYKNNSETATTQKAVSYRPVTLTLDSKNPGATQTAWFATYVPGDSGNLYRNVMLRLETPLSFSIGTFIYTLNSVTNH